MVTGPSNRTLLSKEILKFCGAFPIYNTEVVNNPVYDNGYASKSTLKERYAIGLLFKVLAKIFWRLLTKGLRSGTSERAKARSGGP